MLSHSVADFESVRRPPSGTLQISYRESPVMMERE